MDSTAAAAILHSGSTSFVDLTNDAWLVEDVDRRIQLYKKSAFDLANVKLYFRPEVEEISTIKAAIHLPNGETIKLKNKDMIYDNFNEDVRMISFSFPQVTEGAIIEYTFRRRTYQYTTLPTFYFQEEYPIRWAEYRADVPEYFNFVNLMPPNPDWVIFKEEDESRVFPGGAPLNYHILHYGMKDVPAFSEEPYSNNSSDFLPHTMVQLVSLSLPETATKYYIPSWPALARTLDKNLNFGRKFNNPKDVYDAMLHVGPLASSANTQMEKARIAYQAVAKHMEWNDYFSVQTGNDLNECWRNGSGSSAEINMILLGVLRQLNIDAQPLLVSLRDEGAHITTYPIFEQFDHMMVLAVLDGEEVVLDVDGVDREMGLPRFEALNGSGWVADPDRPRWIELKVPQMNLTVLADINLESSGEAEVSLRGRMDGYYSQTGRYELQHAEEKWEGPLMNVIMQNFPDAEFKDRTIKETTEGSNEPLELQVNLRCEPGQATDEFMYVNPILLPSLDSRLKDTEKRQSPVDFGLAWKERYLANLQLPEGFEVAELPENQRFQSESGEISVKFTAVEGDGMVKVSYTVDFGRAVFQVSEYGGLKAIFARAIDLQESMIVLRKIK